MTAAVFLAAPSSPSSPSRLRSLSAFSPSPPPLRIIFPVIGASFRSINPGETAASMRLMAYVSGLGFGIMSGVFSFVSTLSDSLGRGTVGIHGDPPQCFLNSAFMTLGSYCCTCSGALCVWMPVRRKKWYALLVVLLPYLLVSALSFINPRYGLKLVSAYIILVLTGVWTFFVSAGD
ncbi:hypothetical protein J1605_000523 [Eschrichtius robustus]|uniref:Gamma-secretase subunit APH-1 n=1 Tax=Eschrichtius robustus TaxID=9764 RepID=A0AB34H8C9_ESCRO|nr:hypothetical protein J1605_000523 [Eschrichtius robustus]